MSLNEDRSRLEQAAESLGIGRYKRHVFLCTGPDCCSPDVGAEAWAALKKELKDHGLGSGPMACYRTKAGCLRICMQGPTMVVYPDGAWYHGMVADRIPRFVREHLIGDRPVEEWIFARNPLPADASECDRAK
jgi:(2Fe-2S) ferredoxin